MGSKELIAYTDGSCNNRKGNKGGYGIVMIGDQVRQYCGGSFINTTSARMEIMAIVQAIAKVPKGHSITVFSDNEYAVNTLAKGWIFKWRMEGWRGKKNVDLWKQFLQHYERLETKVTLIWVKGHNGHQYNELADALANLGAERETIIKDNKQ